MANNDGPAQHRQHHPQERQPPRRRTVSKRGCEDICGLAHQKKQSYWLSRFTVVLILLSFSQVSCSATAPSDASTSSSTSKSPRSSFWGGIRQPKLLQSLRSNSSTTSNIRRHWLFGRFLLSGREEERKNNIINQFLGDNPTRRIIVPATEEETALSRDAKYSKEKEDGREEVEEEEEDEKVVTKNVLFPHAFSAALQSVLSDKRRLGRWTASGLQIGLIIYLAHSVWRALVEVLDEYSDLDIGGTTATTTGGGFVKPDQVARTLQFLESSHEAAASLLDSAVKKTSNSQLPNLSLLQLAQKLVACGLPLRSTTATASTTSSSHRTDASVESVLLHLSRGEANLLQQCLWVPPSLLNNIEKQPSLHDLWMQVAGLFPVKERLLGALTTLYRNQPSTICNANDNHNGKQEHQPPQQEDFASLFDSFGGSSSQNPSTPGILLYGPPGCGKTMLVRALATTSRLPCLVVTPSVLLRKYVGETNSQVRQLFSLAHKLAPCILCIDELDGLFRERSAEEHEVSRDLKTEFLQWWDGMLTTTTSSNNGKILVIGATNRPFDVDSAVLRRLPQSHFVGLPDVATRSFMLKRLLSKVPTDDNDMDITKIAMQTEGYSPSDLRQVLQAAALMGPMREAAATRNAAKNNADDSSSQPLQSSPTPVRPLTTNDILEALQHTPPTPMSQNYRMALNNFANQNNRHAGAASAAASADGTANTSNKWETDFGNFYNVGTVQVDQDAFEALHNFVRELDNISDSDEDNDAEDDV